jgi:hypothetical protein
VEPANNAKKKKAASKLRLQKKRKAETKDKSEEKTKDLSFFSPKDKLQNAS